MKTSIDVIREKATKNKERFQETSTSIIGYLYVSKEWLASNGFPDMIRVTLEPRSARHPSNVQAIREQGGLE